MNLKNLCLCGFMLLNALWIDCASAQPPEVITVQGNLPRLNYRDNQGTLSWSIPANSTLWKLDGPIKAGVLIATAAAPSNSLIMNEGGVSIRGTGFPQAKLHVGTITSPTEPGEVLINPGNAMGAPIIHAVNANAPTLMVLETQSPSNAATFRMASAASSFSQSVATNFAIRDNNNSVNPVVIVPGVKNVNSLVIKNGNIGLVSPILPVHSHWPAERSVRLVVCGPTPVAAS